MEIFAYLQPQKLKSDPDSYRDGSQRSDVIFF